MYKHMDRPWPALVEAFEKRCCCCSRQIERAFALYEMTPAGTLRRIRAEAAAARLVQPRAREFSLKSLAMRIGLADDRALRREIGRVWNISPRDLRTAAKLHRDLSAWDRIRKERLDRASQHRRAAASHKAWRDAKSMRRKLGRLLASASPQTRPLINGQLRLRTPQRCADESSEAAAEFLERLEARRLNRLKTRRHVLPKAEAA
jgi:AraC-like DNA-binding protein